MVKLNKYVLEIVNCYDFYELVNFIRIIVNGICNRLLYLFYIGIF